jgi:hypothetical protein
MGASLDPANPPGRLARPGSQVASWRHAPPPIRLRFEAMDGAAASTVEAGLDDIRITQPGP